jgi:VanZ family protein
MTRVREGQSAQRRWAIAAAGVAVAIFVLSSIPAEELARTGIRIWDKAAHAGVWAVLAFCLGRALGARPHAVALTIGLAAGYGVLDEIHQSFTPGRDTSGWDIVADATGAIVGALAAAAARRRADLRGPATDS